MNTPTIGHNQPTIADQLAAEHAELVARAKALLDAKERLPAELDEDTSARMGAFIKQLTGFLSGAEAKRKTAKQPHLDAGRDVDAWFKSLVSGVSDLKAECTKTLTDYQRAIAEAERKKREAEAAAERERQAKIAAEAAERERKALAAKNAQEAEQARLAQIEADLKAQAAEQRAAETDAQMSRTQVSGRVGAQLQGRWVCSSWERSVIDLEELRPFIPKDAIDKALRAYISAGNRTLKGAVIEQEFKTVVR